MARKVIVQTGRLDSSYRLEIEFEYKNVIGRSDLSSSFLTDTKYFNDANRLIIYPISLIFQDRLLKFKDDPFIEQIDNLEIDEYIREPQGLFKDHPQSKDASFMVASSLGKYKFKGMDYSLKGSLDLITLQIYLHLILNYSGDDLENIYIDISSGQNIYVSALTNALYRFLPFMRFYRFMKLHGLKVSGWILNSDPIVGHPTHPITIQKSKLGAKAFNALTYKEFENFRPLVKCIFKGKKYYRELLVLLESEYLLLHSALIRGMPLLLTLVDSNILYSLFRENSLKTIFKDIEDYYKIENEIIGENEASDIFLITFSLAIAQSIYFRFEDVIESRCITFDIDEKRDNLPSINNEILDETFSLLKDEFGQPEPNYKGEITKMINSYKKANRTGEFVLFSALKKANNPDYKINSEFNPRNYFAHSGMELNITQIKVGEAKVSVRYNFDLKDKKRKSILKYLKK